MTEKEFVTYLKSKKGDVVFDYFFNLIQFTTEVDVLTDSNGYDTFSELVNSLYVSYCKFRSYKKLRDVLISYLFNYCDFYVKHYCRY